MSPRRKTMTIEFRPPDVAAVADSLGRLRDAASGWINLLPGIDEDAVDPEPAAGLFAFFGNRAAPVSMATVMPAKKERRDSEGVTIGLMHPTGAKAVARLAEAGVAVPEGWVVRQDHARRGLLVRTPADVVRHGHPHLEHPRRRRTVPRRDDRPVACRRLPPCRGGLSSSRPAQRHFGRNPAPGHPVGARNPFARVTRVALLGQ